MAHFFTRLFFLVVTLAAVSACTGYQDGPAINGKSADVKLIRTWRVVAASENGAAVTTNYVDDLWTFNEDGSLSHTDVNKSISIPPYTQNSVGPKIATGFWSFVEGTAGLEVFYAFEFNDPFNGSVTYRDEYQEVYEIQKFTQKELWLLIGNVQLKLEAL